MDHTMMPIHGASLAELRKAGIDAPRALPIKHFVEKQRRCLANHDQTAQQLAERGGLSPGEMACILADRPLSSMIPDRDALKFILQKLGR